ncbi:hypothetical protein BN1723_011613, partial [Verticillium longisporum]
MSTSDRVDPDYTMEEALVPPEPLSDEEAASEVNVNDINLTMPPISDDDVDNDDAVGHIHTPPPRIAARFYRPTQTRRKDSAASSRRNSISSAHSRCSSAHNYTRRNSDGHQSKLIAQHLRRTSFLEDRKARLTPPATPLKASTKAQPPLPIVLAPGLSGLLPQNRVVVHELAINREYRIPADEYCEHRATFQQPLFEGMRAELHSNESEAGFMYFATMMRYFKESLQRLVRPGAFMHKTIGEVLDVELAEQQFQMGSFSYEKFFTAVSSLLPKLCAPYRDDECKDLVTNKLHQGTLVDRVEALTGFIDVMLCDYVNYMLSTAAPQLIESGPQYEAKKFDEALEKGHHKLTAAVEAWRSARLRVLAEASKRDPEGINHAKNRPTADKFYAQMMVDLFTQALPIREETVPEMLLLDYKRMQRLSLASQRIVTAAAILLQCKNILKRDVRSPWKAEAARIMLVLEAKHDKMETTVHGVMVALEAGRTMPAATKTHLRALVTKVVQASQDSILNGAEPQEPVLRLLLTRLRGHMFARLGAGSASEKVKAASTAGERLAGLGLAEFATEVREIVDELARVGAVDRAAHTKWWEAVSEKVQQEEAATSTTVA